LRAENLYFLATVTISDGKNTLKMTIGKTKARLNGHIYYLDAAPQIVMYKKSIKKRLVVPARSVSEAFGLYYNYSSDNEIVSVARKYNFSIEGRKFTFKDLSCGVEINGKEINLSSLPVLVINNVAYMRAITVFKTGLGADKSPRSFHFRVSFLNFGSESDLIHFSVFLAK
jgi:hypothetical protein